MFSDEELKNRKRRLSERDSSEEGNIQSSVEREITHELMYKVVECRNVNQKTVLHTDEDLVEAFKKGAEWIKTATRTDPTFVEFTQDALKRQTSVLFSQARSMLEEKYLDTATRPLFYVVRDSDLDVALGSTLPYFKQKGRTHKTMHISGDSFPTEDGIISSGLTSGGGDNSLKRKWEQFACV